MKKNHMIGITPAHDAPRFDLLRDLSCNGYAKVMSFPLRSQGANGRLRNFCAAKSRWKRTFARDSKC